MNQQANQPYSSAKPSEDLVSQTSPIEQSVTVIQANQTMVHVSLDMLEKLLGPVLRPDPQDEPGGGIASVRECGQSSLHDQLILRAENAYWINTRILAIAKRLTV